MKTIMTIITLLAVSGWAFATSCMAAVLTAETNAPRPGDCIEKVEMQPIPLNMSGDSILLDLSNLRAGKNHTIKYRLASNNSILECENNSIKYYEIRNDSIYLTRHSQVGMSVCYQIPEQVMAFPAGYGSSGSAYFYGEGNIGNIKYLRNAGYSSTDVDGMGTLITIDGDTLRNVLRCHYSRTGTTMIEDNFRNSFMATRDSNLLSSDSIRHWLANDSVVHKIDRWRWYAPGYRYPIAEAEKYRILYYGTPVDSVNRYYCYRTVNQKYDLERDYANEQIRDNNNTGYGYTDGGNAGGRYKPEQNTGKGNSGNRKYDRGGNLPQNSESGNNEVQVSDGYPYCLVTPTVVTEYVMISYGTSAEAGVCISLHSSSGGLLWQHKAEMEQGDHYVTCDMGAIPAGDYLMVASIGNEIFTTKIIKR